mmetsp:Transcript_20998/g.27138  ORF Transcript_20998/g.27138 Transcript_20998/m.27138 type:complete len:257 (+) Transcript_20998:144-914(+)
MRTCLLFILVFSSAALAFVVPPQQQRSKNIHHVTRSISSGRKNTIVRNMVDDETKSESEVPGDTPSTSLGSDRYDVSKLVGGKDYGAGFNQFDPVLSTTGFLSRRFGILGGLAVFAGLAFVEGREIWKGLDDATPLEGGGTITTPDGLKITEVLIGKSGSTPLPGYIIGLRAVVKIGDQVIYETAVGEKPVAFKYGQRPFQNIICEGVEEGIKGMRVGGKRVLDVPADLAPPGVKLPPGVPLTFEIELTEVLSGYF